MKTKLIQTISAGLAASTMSAFAGGSYEAPAPDPVNNGSWCDTLEDIGKIYKNKDNPYIQEVKVFGRFHYQWGYTDSSRNGYDFSGNGDEVRRFRIGTSVKFLNGFKFSSRVNLEKGGFRSTQFGYDGFDELNLSYNFGDQLGFEDVNIGYGRYKIGFGGEELSSSKKIKTIERSNLNNNLAPRRATGAMIKAERGAVNYTASVFTTDRDNETLGSWNGGVGYWLTAEFEAFNGDVTAQLLGYDGAENDVSRNVKWATSLSYETQVGNWDLFTNASYGEVNGEDLYGFVIMPSTFLIEDKLEAVFRYQYANSSGDQIQINSRNARNVAENELAPSEIGRGDLNHSLYAGLNYYLCGNRAKVMVGAEYETLRGTSEEVEATTLWAAYRMYF